MELTNLKTWLEARKAQDEHLCEVLTILMKNEEPLKLALLSAPGFFKGDKKLSLLGGSITESMFNVARNVHHYSQHYVQNCLKDCLAALEAKDEPLLAQLLYKLMLLMRSQQASLETSGMITIAVRNLRPKIKAAAESGWENYFKLIKETPKEHPLSTMKGFSMLLIGYRNATQTLFDFDPSDPSPITSVLLDFRRENLHDQKSFEFNMKHVLQCFEVGQQVLGELNDVPEHIKTLISLCAEHPYIPAYLELQGFNSEHVSKLQSDIKDFVNTWAKEVVNIGQLDIARRGVLSTEVAEIQPELYEITKENRVKHLDTFESALKAFYQKYESSALTLGLIQAIAQAVSFFYSSQIDEKLKLSLSLVNQFLLSVESSLIEPNYTDTLEGLLGEHHVYHLLKRTEQDAEIVYQERIKHFHQGLGEPHKPTILNHIKTQMKSRLVLYEAESKILEELRQLDNPPTDAQIPGIISARMQQYFFKSQPPEYQEWIDRLKIYTMSEDLFFKGKHHRLACFIQTLLNLGHRPELGTKSQAKMAQLSLEDLSKATVEIVPNTMQLLIEPVAAFQLMLNFGLLPKFTDRNYGFCAFKNYKKVSLSNHPIQILAKQIEHCYDACLLPVIEDNVLNSVLKQIQKEPVNAKIMIDGLDFETTIARYNHALFYGFLPVLTNMAKESLNEVYAKKLHHSLKIFVSEKSLPSPMIAIKTILASGLIPEPPKNSVALVKMMSTYPAEQREVFIHHHDGIQAIKMFESALKLGLIPNFEALVLPLVNESMLNNELIIDFPCAIYATLFKTTYLNSPLVLLKKIIEAGLIPGKMDSDTTWLYNKELKENLIALSKHDPRSIYIDIVVTKVDYAKVAFFNYIALLTRYNIPPDMINISTSAALLLKEYANSHLMTCDLTTDNPIRAIKVAEHGYKHGLRVNFTTKTLKVIEKAIKNEGGNGLIFKRYTLLKQSLEQGSIQ